MVASAILPVAIYKNKLHFLFGKENPNEDSAPGWSDFGGRIEKGETPYQSALREGSEELSGFLGNEKQLKSLIRKNGGTMKLKHNNYYVYLFYIDYDKGLPLHFNNSHYYMWDKIDQKLPFFDKIEIDWFTVEEMTKNRNIFRPFYREIVDLIIKNKQEIHKFINT